MWQEVGQWSDSFSHPTRVLNNKLIIRLVSVSGVGVRAPALFYDQRQWRLGTQSNQARIWSCLSELSSVCFPFPSSKLIESCWHIIFCVFLRQLRMKNLSFRSGWDSRWFLSMILGSAPQLVEKLLSHDGQKQASS
jgi:hypothetical protein